MANNKTPMFNNVEIQNTVPQLTTFQNTYAILEEVDLHDTEQLAKLITKEEMTKTFPHGYNAARNDLIALIKQVWHIAYCLGSKSNTNNND